MAPFEMTRRCASSVMTYRALQIQSADSARSGERKSDAETQRRRASPKKSLRLCVSASSLQVRYIEWLREQLFQSMTLGLPSRVYQDDLDVATELPQDLPARAAGRGEDVRVRGHHHATE